MSKQKGKKEGNVKDMSNLSYSITKQEIVPEMKEKFGVDKTKCTETFTPNNFNF